MRTGAKQGAAGFLARDSSRPAACRFGGIFCGFPEAVTGWKGQGAAGKSRLRDRTAATAPARAGSSFVKNLYGRHRVVETFTSSVQVRGVIEQVMDQYIIEDEDLTAMQTGESIVATLHYPPFSFRMKPYGG